MITRDLAAEEKKQKKIASWFSEYGKRLLAFISSRVRDVEEAQDIAQEIWYQLARQPDPGSIEAIGNWLFHAARNRVINFYRKKKTVPLSGLGRAGDHTEDSENTDDILFNQWIEERLPDEILESGQFWEKLDEALDRLPEEQRQVFIANELEDKSYKTLSAETGIPVNTLLSRKRYAVLKLREIFNEWL
jgi:RNA polymerase sigma factor (sigma-70 family)